MISSTEGQSSPFLPIRVWIPLLLLPAMILLRLAPSLIQDGPSMTWAIGAFGPFLVSLLLVAWWLGFSRAKMVERFWGLVGIVLILILVSVVADPSIHGPLFIVMTIPMVIAGFALGACLFGGVLGIQRTWLALGIALLGASVSTLVKTDGVWGNFAFGMDWRWNPSAEDKFLSTKDKASQPQGDSIPQSAFQSPEWPGFRGPRRDGVQTEGTFSLDWKSKQPQEVWRIQVGPAWSSFAFATKYLVTQEQRGEKESVVCYDADTGKELWESSLESRFFESLGGLGPRATPTIAAGNVYALGAEGWFVKLNAANGQVEWKVDVRKDAERDPPMWGFSSSPFVVGDLAIIHAGGKGDKGVLAYDNQTGALRWSVPAGEHSYGSLQMVRLVDRDLLCLLSNLGAHLWDPSTGRSVLDYAWEHSGYRALQPQVIDGDKLLIPTGMGSGCRLVQFSESSGGIEAKELWTSREMKPDFNDVVVHKGHIYGFDNSIFACIDLKDGKRKWKGGRYGKGQCLLLPNSDLIIVLAESGELALVKATESSHQELAKFQSVEGKTWNHPVVVGNRLYVRNAAEAVCYRLD